MLPLAFLSLVAMAEDAAKIDPELLALRAKGEAVDVIVKFKKGAGKAVRAALKRDLEGFEGGVMRATAADLERLASDPSVEAVYPDREVTAFLDRAAAATRATAAWQSNLDGSGIGVAIIDSGIYRLHNDLKDASGNSRVVYSEDFTNSGSTDDLFGHGTHVAVTLAGNGAASSGSTSYTRAFRGVAPKARLINLKALNNTGAGTDSSVIAAIQRAIALKSTYNIRVINLSLGRAVTGPYANDPLCQAVKQARDAGILVVVAAGNYGRVTTGKIAGYGTITSPGNSPWAITVGAMKTVNTNDRSDDRIASYSSKGPTLYDHVVKPDLVAPGNTLISGLSQNAINTATSIRFSASTILTMGEYTTITDPRAASSPSVAYYRVSGTSMATPMVAGAAALLFQQNPSLTAGQVKARLMRTAYKSFPSSSTATDPSTGVTYTSYYDMFTIGAGYLDIGAAAADTASFSGTAQSPAVTYDAVRDTGRLSFASGSGFGGSSIVWGENVVWGSSTLSGSNVVWGSSIVWGENVVWGSASATEGFNVVWGSAGVNSTSIVWGENTGITNPMNVLTRGEQ